MAVLSILMGLVCKSAFEKSCWVELLGDQTKQFPNRMTHCHKELPPIPVI
jgi:hypothetical protein